MTQPLSAPLPYHELQDKILPELHLIAAGLGIENYRKLKKDTLALAILEKQAEAEGQVLARGFLEMGLQEFGRDVDQSVGGCGMCTDGGEDLVIGAADPAGVAARHDVSAGESLHGVSLFPGRTVCCPVGHRCLLSPGGDTPLAFLATRLPAGGRGLIRRRRRTSARRGRARRA